MDIKWEVVDVEDWELKAQFEQTRAGWPQDCRIALHYVSGEAVRVNDFVLRIREDVDLEDNKNKFDALDVYDGPFRISDIPATDPDRDEKEVRLSFPEGSLGSPLTKLARLRPIFEIQADTPEGMNARSCYYWPKSQGRQKAVINGLVSGDDADNETAGVACLYKGTYVRVCLTSPHVAHDENGTLYEVEKLRDKKIERCPRDDFPDENMDDPVIVQYIRSGGVVDESEVLVVKYRVHWAGWPSEDDTYERAQGNIPDVLIQAYEAANGPAADVPKPSQKLSCVN